MTLGPEWDDISDDAGNLRPDVARAIQQVPDRPVAHPAAPVPPRPQVQRPPIGGPPEAMAPEPRRTVVEPAPLFGLPRPRARQVILTIPDLSATRVSLATMVVPLVAVAIVAAMMGALLTSKRPASPVDQSGFSRPGDVTAGLHTESPQGARALVITGVNVNLRSGPGLGYPVVAKLQDGESVSLLDERGGWASIATNSGTIGWMFGAYLSGAASSTHGPAIVRRLMILGTGNTRVVLRPGERVLHYRTPDGRDIALLPDGRQISVLAGGLADAR